VYNTRIRLGEGILAMKKKLTITIDEELIPKAKKFAYSRGESLSSLVERTLREAAVKYEPTLSSRWRGRFRPAEGDDPKYEALARKYLR